MSFTDDKAHPSSSIGSFNHLSSANLSQNRINTVGRDLYETHHNYYQIIKDSKGWRIKTMGSILEIGQTVIQGIAGLLYGSGSSSSIETTTQESIETLEELFNGTDYRVHSARHKGRSVIVKVFHGPRAKEADIFVYSVMSLIQTRHPSMLRMMTCSPSSSQTPFIVFGDECERGSVDHCVASALTDGLPRTVMLGFQLIGGLSAGLDYLSTVVGVPLSTVGRDNYEVYITSGDQVKIGLGNCKTGRHGEDDSEADWVLFNDLCSKHTGLRVVCVPEEEDIDRNEASIAEDAEADGEPNSQFQPSPFVSSGSPDFPDILPSSTMITPRRELQWTRSPQVSTLSSVSRRYRDHLRMSPYRGALDLRRLNAKRRFEVIPHRCQGYRKEEITFTSEIKECAVVLHTMPFRGEICLICGEIVTEGVFRCICGQPDDGSSATIRCSNCHAWQHRTCVIDLSALAGQYTCLSCQQTHSEASSMEFVVPDETLTRPSSPSASRRNDDDRAASPVSSVSSASEPPLSARLKANGAPPVPRDRSLSPTETVDVREGPTTSEPPPASTATQDPPIAPASPTRSWPPQWLSSAMHSTQAKYPNDKFEFALGNRVSDNASRECLIKCVDCPGKLYKPGPGETLSNFEVHLKNRQHRQRVDDRVNKDS
ncbi:hypothetical protein D9758_009400 [Tetrapyrgos nigripes]|uniref:Zinc finger PHD-type domain-containing protein n=1 Tax=Tetrapyrgos nigripes TaxID=182062 RepID=A0A8H5D228_9AGAR|nr:hypothetical protein D9758_009400 [Tetrapyrgos nigripes]